MTATLPDPRFDHLLRLTDRRGTFEHACFAEPRPEHGYCTDDMARVLVVATREPNSGGEVNRLARVAVGFLNDAQSYAGACRNRMDSKGRWEDEPSLGDWWGRCIWGLGTAAAHSDVVWFGGWPSFSSNAPRRYGRPGLGRWRSRRWALPNCSPLTPGTGSPAHSLPTTPTPWPNRTATRPGHGLSRDSPTRMRFSPRR